MGLKRLLSSANAMVGIASGDINKITRHQCLVEAESGNVTAQYTIGCYYACQAWDTEDCWQYDSKIRPVKSWPPDPNCVGWLSMAAKQGHVGAMVELGRFFLGGWQYAPHADKAAKWLLQAAELGDTWSMIKLGDLYGDGEGVPQDDKKACEWWLKAFDLGESYAMLPLTSAYLKGAGVTQDIVKAIQCFKLSGNVPSPIVEDLYESATKEQEEEADALAKKFASKFQIPMRERSLEELLSEWKHVKEKEDEIPF